MSVVQSETLYSLYWNLCINPSSVSVDWSATSGAQPWSIIDICQFPRSSLSIFYHLYSSQYLSNSFSALSPSHRSPSMVSLSLWALSSSFLETFSSPIIPKSILKLHPLLVNPSHFFIIFHFSLDSRSSKSCLPTSYPQIITIFFLFFTTRGLALRCVALSEDKH